MICLRCDNEEFLPKQDAVIEQEFRNELFQIRMPALACAKCGWVTVDLKQADELRKRTADAYRKKHALLTSDEIRALRKLIGMNQRDFARFLGVGEASVKRWETWLVQENSSDQLIRMKCAPLVRSTLVQPVITPVWISFRCPLQERSAGIRTAPGDAGPAGRCTAPVLPASRWKLPAQTDGPADQDELELHDLDESTADALPRAA